MKSYLKRNGMVILDDGGPGEVLSDSFVVELPRGFLVDKREIGGKVKLFLDRGTGAIGVDYGERKRVGKIKMAQVRFCDKPGFEWRPSSMIAHFHGFMRDGEFVWVNDPETPEEVKEK